MIKKIFRSEFVKNVTTLVTGTAIAHAITLLFSIILVRLYSPEDFGILALFLSVFQIASAFITLKFEHTIILPEQNKDARDIISLILVIASISALIYFILFSLLKGYISDLLNESRLEPWLMVIPFYLFIWSIHQSIFYWFNRTKKYKAISLAIISQSSVGALAKTGLGFVKYMGGLILGTIIGELIATLYLLLKAKEVIRNLSFKTVSLKASFKRYWKLAISLVVSYEIQTVYLQIPVLFFNKYFEASVAGFFFLAQRIVAMPISLISRSVGDVFRQEATDIYHETGRFDKLFLSTFKKMFFISFIPFLLLFIIAPELFSLIFGEEWRIAGDYARILVVGEFVTFVSSPFNKASLIREKKQYIFYWNLSRLFFMLIVSGISILYKLEVTQFLWLFVAVRTSHYIWDFFACYRFSKGK
ncbi:MAG: oligosaccharide flippase family protein [Bacteroidales bacterium]|nr:oligosaccharide flippase family protein [Bacteroidales bacterium]